MLQSYFAVSELLALPHLMTTLLTSDSLPFPSFLFSFLSLPFFTLTQMPWSHFTSVYVPSLHFSLDLFSFFFIFILSFLSFNWFRCLIYVWVLCCELWMWMWMWVVSFALWVKLYIELKKKFCHCQWLSLWVVMLMLIWW